MKTLELFKVHDVGPREWGREILIAHTPEYIGKLLFMKEGSAGGLQYHKTKDETFYLYEGVAEVTYDDGKGHLTTHVMVEGESFHVPTKAPHKVRAVTDCVFFEASSPVFDDRVRVEREYGLEGEDVGLPTTA